MILNLIESVSEGFPSYFYRVYIFDYYGLTLTCFMARSNSVPQTFEWEKLIRS